MSPYRRYFSAHPDDMYNGRGETKRCAMLHLDGRRDNEGGEIPALPAHRQGRFRDYEEEIALLGKSESPSDQYGPIQGMTIGSYRAVNGVKKWNSAGVIINARYATPTTKSTFEALADRAPRRPGGRVLRMGEPGVTRALKEDKALRKGQRQSLFMAGCIAICGTTASPTW